MRFLESGEAPTQGNLPLPQIREVKPKAKATKAKAKAKTKAKTPSRPAKKRVAPTKKSKAKKPAKRASKQGKKGTGTVFRGGKRSQSLKQKSRR
jgi:hypothetical protein